MQTFLPYPDFRASAKALDCRRLGKQRVEAMQILKALRGKTKGWVNHPATIMWRGYEDALGMYMNACISEWIARGYKNNMPPYTFNDPGSLVSLPRWFGNEKFHAAHRANLLRKDPDFYGQYGWTEDPSTEYIWPTHKGEVYYVTGIDETGMRTPGATVYDTTKEALNYAKILLNEKNWKAVTISSIHKEK